ncbi:Sugar/inositol transporter [Macrophomina phaseolina MS6]|uniref:Sugar/inositol transporter n=2 Tax=Macrophomina phaseolina TaxID=35725 RepID=K2RKC7_MACPH|nr:Sugar/inositol transporter [Macrophomina phaseolina MS6]KAH7043906.1 general substrate transporter [Macrophomina phaseolina]
MPGIYKEALKDTPKEVMNWRLFYGVFVFGLMGAARGLDEGLTGTTAEQVSFIEKFGLEDPSLSESAQANLLSNITSMVQMGSILGALIAFFITDRIGRLWATRELCMVWVTGIAIYLAASANGSIGMVYAGRFIAGVGIGQTTVVAPTYLAEVSPRALRGLCVCMFAGSVYLGIMLGYFASWGASLHISDDNQAQWVVPNSLHLMFASIIFALSFGAIESPRWLIKVHKHEQAADNLSRLRQLPSSHPFVQTEIIDINDQLNREAEATRGTAWFGVVKELFGSSANRYRLMLSLFSQLLSQWSGANSITIYAPEYFKMMGTTGQSEKLFATAIFGVVKFVSALLCALFLIDFVGRKRSLSCGIALQFVSMLYMAIFLAIDSGVAEEGAVQSPSQKHAAMGAIVMIYFSGFGWALGWNSVQYLINSEIYPLRLRAIGGSIAMTIHFVNQWGNSKAVPSMFIGLGNSGTMFFFSGVTAVGFLWVWFFLPETSGKSLESMDRMFELPWYLIGRKGKQISDSDPSTLAEAYNSEKADEKRIEDVREVGV